MLERWSIGDGTWLLGDTFDGMATLPAASVDMILCDLPYGTTQNKWDCVLPLDRLWAEYWRVCKPNAAVVLTAAQPFTSVLVCSQLSRFKYEWIWRKTRPTGQLNAKREPLRDKEDILIFYRKSPVYNPQMTIGTPNHVNEKPKVKSASANWGAQYEIVEQKTNEKYPRAVLDFTSLNPTTQIHPTQKPEALWQYLIRTYTNPGDLVLDNTAGSGTTAVAAQATGRRWVCIERDEEYSAKAMLRIAGAL